MRPSQAPYSRYALCGDMWDSINVFRTFDPDSVVPFLRDMGQTPKRGLFITGEGSSRIFPAQRVLYESLKGGESGPLVLELPLYAEGATQALEYDLRDFHVVGVSNSGRTKELIRLFTSLKGSGHSSLYGVTAHGGSPLEGLCRRTFVLHCGKEGAVAATKSVMEQALFLQALARALARMVQRQASEGGTLPAGAAVPAGGAMERGFSRASLSEAADKLERALSLKWDPEIVKRVATCETLYFAGRNNGVGEELALKTNEITRKKSDYLEGTYAVHGIEEVMDTKDAVVLIDPFPQEEEKFQEVLQKGVGCFVCAIASRQTSFPTVLIPEDGVFQNYLELAAGWNLLVEVGLALGVDLDKPARARKVGNEAQG